MTRRVEICGINQKVLEDMYLRKIHEINTQLRMMNAKYNNWDNVDDERLKARYTREEYKTWFINRKFEERRTYIYKLRNVRNGFVLE